MSILDSANRVNNALRKSHEYHMEAKRELNDLMSQLGFTVPELSADNGDSDRETHADGATGDPLTDPSYNQRSSQPLPVLSDSGTPTFTPTA